MRDFGLENRVRWPTRGPSFKIFLFECKWGFTRIYRFIDRFWHNNFALKSRYGVQNRLAPLEPATMIYSIRIIAYIQGPKWTFLGRHQLATEMFFNHQIEKGQLNFSFSAKHKNAKFPKTFILVKIFLLLNNRKSTYHWLWVCSSEFARLLCQHLPPGIRLSILSWPVGHWHLNQLCRHFLN